MSATMNRRQFVEWSTHGLGSIALLELLQKDGVLTAAAPSPTASSHPPRVKRAIQICLVGGMSHVDSYDYKPELTKKQG